MSTFTIEQIQKINELTRFYVAMRKFREGVNHANHPDIVLHIEAKDRDRLIPYHLTVPLSHVAAMLDEQIGHLREVLLQSGVAIGDDE